MANLYLRKAELYNAIYQYVMRRSDVAELTVEDPAEAFEDLRDKNDLKMLLANEQFMQEGFSGEVSHGGGRVGGVGRTGKSGRGGTGVSTKGKMGPPADKAWVEKWRKDLKIAGVSFSSNIRSSLQFAEDSMTEAVSTTRRNAYSFTVGCI